MKKSIPQIALSLILFTSYSAIAEPVKAIVCGNVSFGHVGGSIFGWGNSTVWTTKVDSDLIVRAQGFPASLGEETGALTFDLAKGTGTIQTTKGETFQCSYDPLVFDLENNFSVDLCVGKFSRIHRALFLQKTVDFKYHVFGKSSIDCVLATPKEEKAELVSNLVETKLLAQIDPNQSADGNSPIFKISGEVLDFYIKTFSSKIDFEVKDRNGDTVMHQKRAEDDWTRIIDAVTDISHKKRLLRSRNSSNQTPLMTSLARLEAFILENPFSNTDFEKELHRLKFLVTKHKELAEPVPSINLFESVVRSKKPVSSAIEVTSSLHKLDLDEWGLWTKELVIQFHQVILSSESWELAEFFIMAKEEHLLPEFLFPELTSKQCLEHSGSIEFALIIHRYELGDEACRNSAAQLLQNFDWDWAEVKKVSPDTTIDPGYYPLSRFYIHPTKKALIKHDCYSGVPFTLYHFDGVAPIIQPLSDLAKLDCNNTFFEYTDDGFVLSEIKGFPVFSDTPNQSSGSWYIDLRNGTITWGPPSPGVKTKFKDSLYQKFSYGFTRTIRIASSGTINAYFTKPNGFMLEKAGKLVEPTIEVKGKPEGLFFQRRFTSVSAQHFFITAIPFGNGGADIYKFSLVTALTQQDGTNIIHAKATGICKTFRDFAFYLDDLAPDRILVAVEDNYRFGIKQVQCEPLNSSPITLEVKY